MLKGLNTLIRLHRRHIDVLRRSLSDLEQRRAQLLAISAQLDKELQNELKLASEYAALGNFFGNFAHRIDQAKQKIAEDVFKLEQDMARISEQIAEQYSELKKFEITRDNILKRQKEEAERKEQILMDEIGVQRYSRQEMDTHD